ncbi:MAG: PAS domain-containing protein [Gammaproteobacteria bacterium]
MNLPLPNSLVRPAQLPFDAEPSSATTTLIDVIDAQGVVAWANGAEAAALGYADGTLAGLPAVRFYAPAAVEWLRALSAQAADEPAEIVLLRRDGSELHVLAQALGHADARGRVTIAKSPLGALAARLRRLEAENELLRKIADTGHEAHWCIEFADPIDVGLPIDEIVFRVFSHPSYWRLCNQAMSRLYGLPHHVDLCAQSVRTYWPRSTENEAFVRRIIESGWAIDGALSVDARHDGAPVMVENDVRADIEHGRLVRLWGSCRPLGGVSAPLA